VLDGLRDAVDVSKLRIDPIGMTNGASSATGALWERGDVVTVTLHYPWSIGLPGMDVLSGEMTTRTSVRLD
jgi:hypothetical protein